MPRPTEAELTEADPAYADREQVKILPIRTGFLVKSKQGWFAFDSILAVCGHLQKIMGGGK